MEIVSWKQEFKINFEDILFVEDQKKKLFENIKQFSKTISLIIVSCGARGVWANHL